MGKGIVGAFANPISGGLDALSTTFEGFDAASSSLLGRARPQAAIRSRLPRAIGGDHKLLPFRRMPDNDERQVMAQAGLAPALAMMVMPQKLYACKRDLAESTAPAAASVIFERSVVFLLAADEGKLMNAEP